ncbi:MAG: hypothetical protein M1834_000950 [Cirrosporium novae-zelandiae]|nr:MAG: hypothetical protein M1834_000950 [Cirrosporium novae-zelandiae]
MAPGRRRPKKYINPEGLFPNLRSLQRDNKKSLDRSLSPPASRQATSDELDKKINSDEIITRCDRLQNLVDHSRTSKRSLVEAISELLPSIKGFAESVKSIDSSPESGGPQHDYPLEARLTCLPDAPKVRIDKPDSMKEKEEIISKVEQSPSSKYHTYDSENDLDDNISETSRRSVSPTTQFIKSIRKGQRLLSQGNKDGAIFSLEAPIYGMDTVRTSRAIRKAKVLDW